MKTILALAVFISSLHGFVHAQNIIDFSKIRTPIIFRGDYKFAYRDPAVIYANNTFYLYFTLCENSSDRGYYSMIAYSKSTDLIFWTYPKAISPRNRNLNYSSPGNIIKYNDDWVICLQTYPTPMLESFGNANSRIFIMRSKNLEDWGEPELLKVKGNNVSESEMGRMIDQIAIIEEPFAEELEIDVLDIPVRLAADESAHTVDDAIKHMEMGYKAIALKAIAKTLSMTMKIAQASYERDVPCFCADLTINPILVEWNKNVAARLKSFP